jgi:maleylacetate reductase
LNPFIYQQFPIRVRFGEGAVKQLFEEAGLAGMRRVLVLCTPEQKSQAQMAADLLGDRFDVIFDGA